MYDYQDWYQVLWEVVNKWVQKQENMWKDEVDFLIIGGGIFGVYVVIYLVECGVEVILVEKEKQLMCKVFIVNQVCLYGGYYYL